MLHEVEHRGGSDEVVHGAHEDDYSDTGADRLLLGRRGRGRVAVVQFRRGGGGGGERAQPAPGAAGDQAPAHAPSGASGENDKHPR